MNALKNFQRFNRTLLIAALVIVADQWLKAGREAQINSGISFSLLRNVPAAWLTGALSVFLLVLILLTARTAWKEGRTWWLYVVFVSAGASNLLDRWQFGGVRDVWYLPIVGVHNNLADWLILLSVLGIFVQMWYKGHRT